MREDLLQFIWQQKLLLKFPLQTTQGKPLNIIKTGRLNRDSGPDFFEARIDIDNTLWVGNVEIHVNSSDWLKHQHQHDKAYNNVILHVVFNDDTPLNIPTLELKNYLSPSLLVTYQALMHSSLRIPCENIIKFPDGIVLKQFMHRLMISRLENKCTLLNDELLRYQNNWAKLFYTTLAKYFGMTVNAEPFQQLAQLLPQELLAKHKYSSAQIDALIFGVAGFLPSHNNDEYTALLNREFEFLKHKYQLQQMPVNIWKFAKTRPSNFPTTRLAQFSALVFHSVHLFSKLMAAKNIKEAERLLMATPTETLNLDALHPVKHLALKELGKPTIHHLLINVVIPFKFIFGKHMMDEQLCEQAIDWLELLPAEKNSFSRFWLNLGLEVKHALHSQSIIELSTNLCHKHGCLNCAIGNHILAKHV